ncbi:MAG: HD domain-containing protein [Candidatus Omnitrophica bacterium]|nr:HD domain-containing protein [Candidatus Omnitrophota bacterium]
MDPSSLVTELSSHLILKKILRFSEKKKARLYLVGGILRDILLKRKKENPDVDFCLKGSAIAFGRMLAKELGAGFVVLDREHGCCRLVKSFAGKNYTLDFTDFRGDTIEKDLFCRDFTINAMALGLRGALERGKPLTLIDPYGGLEDLKKGVIRMLNGRSFDEDPLRIMRAFSLSCLFGFKIEKKTQQAARIKRKKLIEVSSERIRDELFKVLEGPDSFLYLEEMEKMGIFKYIMPELEITRGIGQGPYHHLDVFRHTLETLRQYEKLVIELKRDKEIRDYLDEVVSSQRRRSALVKLGALLHDAGKPATLRKIEGKTIFHGHERVGLEIAEGACRRLKLSNDEISSICRMVLWHLRPGYLADNKIITARASFRYFRDTRKEAVGILLLSIADQRATRGRLTSKVSRARQEKVAFGLIKEYFKKQKEKHLPRLVNGDDLIRAFKLKPSPLIGEILRQVEELQAIGKVTTKPQALKAAKKYLPAPSRNKTKSL